MSPSVDDRARRRKGALRRLELGLPPPRERGAGRRGTGSCRWRAQDDDGRSEVLLRLAHTAMRSVEKTDAAGLCRDLAGGHPVQLDHDVVGFAALSPRCDLAPAVER